MHAKTTIQIGQRFGKLVTVGRTVRDKHNRLMWDCLCDCGNFHRIEGGQLLAGCTKSCGCNCEKHGAANHQHPKGEYRAWMAAKARCFDTNCKSYKDYGARGITMCEEWKHSYLTFIKHMGERPSGLTLERVNNDGNYEPGNCIWASCKVQANNKRNSKKNNDRRRIERRISAHL